MFNFVQVAYEEEEDRKRKMNTQEMHDILQNQIKGRKVYEEECERMKAEERARMDKLREDLIYEAELGLLTDFNNYYNRLFYFPGFFSLFHLFFIGLIFSL